MALEPLSSTSGDLALSGLTLQDQRRIQDALDGSTSANTRRAYNQAWRRFEAWMKQRGPGHPLPATPELVAAFLAELGEEGKLVATLRLTKSALAAVHRSTGHKKPTDNEGLRKVMAGLARANGRPQRQAKPLTETALAAVKATAGIPRRYRDRAVRAENAWAARRPAAVRLREHDRGLHRRPGPGVGLRRLPGAGCRGPRRGQRALGELPPLPAGDHRPERRRMAPRQSGGPALTAERPDGNDRKEP